VVGGKGSLLCFSGADLGIDSRAQVAVEKLSIFFCSRRYKAGENTFVDFILGIA
jgi:hypothetical protein